MKRMIAPWLGALLLIGCSLDTDVQWDDGSLAAGGGDGQGETDDGVESSGQLDGGDLGEGAAGAGSGAGGNSSGGDSGPGGDGAGAGGAGAGGPDGPGDGAGGPGDPGICWYVEGNPNCSSLGLGLQITKIEPVLAGLYDDISLDTDGQIAAFASTVIVDAVIIKGGPGAIVCTFEGGTTSADGLEAPTQEGNDDPHEISHLTFCSEG